MAALARAAVSGIGGWCRRGDVRCFTAPPARLRPSGPGGSPAALWAASSRPELTGVPRCEPCARRSAPRCWGAPTFDARGRLRSFLQSVWSNRSRGRPARSGWGFALEAFFLCPWGGAGRWGCAFLRALRWRCWGGRRRYQVADFASSGTDWVPLRMDSLWLPSLVFSHAFVCFSSVSF